MNWFSETVSKQFLSDASTGLISVGILFAVLFIIVAVLTIKALKRK